MGDESIEKWRGDGVARFGLLVRAWMRASGFVHQGGGGECTRLLLPERGQRYFGERREDEGRRGEGRRARWKHVFGDEKADEGRIAAVRVMKRGGAGRGTVRGLGLGVCGGAVWIFPKQCPSGGKSASQMAFRSRGEGGRCRRE